MHILVAYVSKTGTTEEISRRIGDILASRKEAGETTDSAIVTVKPISEVASLEGVDRLVLGSPINGMKVLPEFRTFLQEHVAGKGIPSALFIVSYLYLHGSAMWKRAIAREAEHMKQLAGADSVAIFGGRLPSAMPAFARLLFGVKGNPPLDIRNWEEIERWAGRL